MDAKDLEAEFSSLETDELIDRVKRGLVAEVHTFAIAELERRGVVLDQIGTEQQQLPRKRSPDRVKLVFGYAFLVLAIFTPAFKFSPFHLVVMVVVFVIYGGYLIKDANHDSHLTELMRTAANGDIASMANALDADGNINDVDEQGATALIYALLNRQGEAARWLISQGADTRTHTRRGLTALEMAEKKGMREIVELITSVR